MGADDMDDIDESYVDVDELDAGSRQQMAGYKSILDPH